MKNSNSPTPRQLADYVAEAKQGYDVDMLLTRGRGHHDRCYKDREPFNDHELYTVAVQPIIIVRGKGGGTNGMRTNTDC